MVKQTRLQICAVRYATYSYLTHYIPKPEKKSQVFLAGNRHFHQPPPHLLIRIMYLCHLFGSMISIMEYI